MWNLGVILLVMFRWADLTSAPGQKGVYEEHLCDNLFDKVPCPDDDRSANKSHNHKFDHPFVQSLCMFFGEMTCFLAYKVIVTWKRSQGKRPVKAKPFNPLIFLFPACCDMTGTSIMNVGLTMTYASSFQMLRGAVMIFTGLLSVAFLRDRLRGRQWFGMMFVVVGLLVIGVGDALYGGDNGLDKTSQLTGDLLIVMAQIIIAVQMTYEQKFIVKYDVPPLQAVGWEGIWGLTVLGLLQFAFYFIPASFSSIRPERLENVIDAAYQIGNSRNLVLATIGLVLSISFFNFTGVTVTKEMNATTRMVLDSVRTLFIWVVSLSIPWESFQPLQPVGYVLLVCGTFIYYNLVFGPLWKKIKGRGTNHEKEPLLFDKASGQHSGIGVN